MGAVMGSDVPPPFVDLGLALDPDELRSALEAANIPTLLMVLAHLTSDDRWLRAPYAPTRTRGMDDNASGGLPAAVQAEIRASAHREILDAARTGAEPPTLSEPLLAAMMSVCMGETVPDEYAAMLLEEMGMRRRDPSWPQPPEPGRLESFHVLVIGAGVSGICAAIRLQQQGIPFTVLERSDAVGGTWLDNAYPGCGVDTPSHLYSYSFAPHDWSRYFAKRDEIKGYLEQCVRRFDVGDRIRLSTEVTRAAFDESSSTWSVTTQLADGSTRIFTGNALISAVGQLNEPAIPDIPGAERFTGPVAHSARWTADLDVRGKRVGVIGAGASAMQIVPAIAGAASEVVVFQRSPQWAAPSENYQRAVPDGVRYLTTHVPLYAAWYRSRLVWSFSDKIFDSLHVDPKWPDQQRSINAVNDAHRRFFTRHLVEELGERQDLLADLLPTYPPFAKRMLLDNSWASTIARDDVKLVTERVAEINATGVRTAGGNQYDVEALIYATGFRTLRLVGSYDVIGRGGRSLRSVWGEDDAYAYLGISVPDFPNFFCLYGPNTSLGHGGSLIALTEAAVRYVTRVLQTMIVDDLAVVECRADVCAAYNEQVDAAHRQMIWNHPGATNWYRNARGRVVTNSPWRVLDYWRMTHEPDLADFTTVRRVASSTVNAS